MSDIFLKILNMSAAGGIMILAVVLARFLLRKAPKWTRLALWGLVALRLAAPVFIESPVSLMPRTEIEISSARTAEVSPPEPTEVPAFTEMPTATEKPIVTQRPAATLRPTVTQRPTATQRPAAETPAATQVPVGTERPTEPAATILPAGPAVTTDGDSGGPGFDLLSFLSYAWLTGAALMLAYAVITYALLKKKLATAVRLEGNVFEADSVKTPFLLGLFAPKIYLPFGLGARSRELVLLHEKAHVKALDHIIKPLGWALLSVHWFNPLAWLAFALMSKDVELACDERVIKKLDENTRADYSQTLLDLSVNKRRIAACPLAFGESNTKERVKNVLNYKKPAFWIIIAAVLVIAAAAVCLLTIPKKDRSAEAPGEPEVEDSPAPTEVPQDESRTLEFRTALGLADENGWAAVDRFGMLLPSSEERWNAFSDKADSGEPAEIVIIRESRPEHPESDDGENGFYFIALFYKLNFDGEKYRLSNTAEYPGEFSNEEEYLCLNRIGVGDEPRCSQYVLMNYYIDPVSRDSIEPLSQADGIMPLFMIEERTAARLSDLSRREIIAFLEDNSIGVDPAFRDESFDLVGIVGELESAPIVDIDGLTYYQEYDLRYAIGLCDGSIEKPEKPVISHMGREGCINKVKELGVEPPESVFPSGTDYDIRWYVIRFENDINAEYPYDVYFGDEHLFYEQLRVALFYYYAPGGLLLSDYRSYWEEYRSACLSLLHSGDFDETVYYNYFIYNYYLTIEHGDGPVRVWNVCRTYTDKLDGSDDYRYEYEGLLAEYPAELWDICAEKLSNYQYEYLGWGWWPGEPYVGPYPEALISGDDSFLVMTEPWQDRQANVIMHRFADGEWREFGNSNMDDYPYIPMGFCITDDDTCFVCYKNRYEYVSSEGPHESDWVNVWATYDGGSTWKCLDLMLPSEYKNVYPYPVAFSPVFDGELGVIPVYASFDSCRRYAWFVTKDGGRTWTFGGDRAVPYEADPQETEQARSPISAGYLHSAVILQDGTVAASGANRRGECGVSDWTDVVSVAAGQDVTVGLRSDGTVVAVGDNTDGRCEVSGWTDITAIAVNWMQTIGLRKDGTIVATDPGIDELNEMLSWTDIAAISAAGSYAAGLRSDGTVVVAGVFLEGNGFDLSSWTDIVAISAGASHLVGLKADGTVTAALMKGAEDRGECDVSAWTDIIAVSAGDFHTVGLKSDGSVVAVGYDEFGPCEVSSWKDIAAISAGFHFTLGVKADGTVVAAGRNDQGQCGIAGLKASVLSEMSPVRKAQLIDEAWVLAEEAAEIHGVTLLKDTAVVDGDGETYDFVRFWNAEYSVSFEAWFAFDEETGEYAASMDNCRLSVHAPDDIDGGKLRRDLDEICPNGEAMVSAASGTSVSYGYAAETFASMFAERLTGCASGNYFRCEKAFVAKVERSNPDEPEMFTVCIVLDPVNEWFSGAFSYGMGPLYGGPEHPEWRGWYTLRFFLEVKHEDGGYAAELSWY